MSNGDIHPRKALTLCASESAMLPSWKDPVIPQTSPAPSVRTSPVASVSSRREEIVARPQPVCLEVPVTLNGVRAVEDGSKREPFSESTRTVLVFANGAVIRLATPISSGQLVFLTNERTKKEIVCQVVKSKNYRNVSGYVELEFTEPAIGYWGMRFPADKLGSAAGDNSSQAISSESSAPAPFEMPRAAEPQPVPQALQLPKVTLPAPPPLKPAAPPVQPSAPPQKNLSAEPVPDSPADATLGELLGLLDEEEEREENFPAPIDQGEFAANLFELADAPENSAPAPAPKSVAPAPPAAAPLKIVPSASQPSPASSTDETVLPLWLTPAAYSGISTPIKPPVYAPPVKSVKAVPVAPEPVHVKEAAGPVADFHEPPAAPWKAAGSEPQEPIGFTSPFAAEEQFAAQPAKKKGGSGLVIGAIAAVLIAGVAAGGWFYVNKMSGRSTEIAAATSKPLIPSASALTSNPPAAAASSPPLDPQPQHAANTAAPLNAAPAGAAPSQSLALVNTSERLSAAPKEKLPAASKNVQPEAPATNPVESPAADATKKFVLPKVKLASPVISNKESARNNAAEPDESLSNITAAPVGGDVAAVAASNGVQPVAPKADLPSGGDDVKPAKLLSTVAPAYPQLARSQRISGNVVVDALIEPNGRVSATKVISGHPLLQQAAIDAVRQRKYQPATLDGKPVQMHLNVTVQFRLQQ